MILLQFTEIKAFAVSNDATLVQSVVGDLRVSNDLRRRRGPGQPEGQQPEDEKRGDDPGQSTQAFAGLRPSWLQDNICIRNRRRLFRRSAAVHRPDEPVAPPIKSLNKAGILGIVAQGLAKLLDCTVQAEIEINKSVLRPQALLQFFAGDDLPRSLQQHGKDLQRLILELDLETRLT